MSSFPRPYATIASGPATLRFYLGDCVDWLKRLPAGAIDVIVTSPPYNLGIQYRSYDDALPRDEYLQWTSRWIAAATRALGASGSLFLNVGAKPTDPWAGLDVAQVARGHLHLQNTLHWIKSIAISREDARGRIEDDLAVGHYKPINSLRFVNDCHEYIFQFTPDGARPLDRLAVGVPYQDRSNAARWQGGAGGVRCRGNTWFIPYETIQSRDKDRPHPATFPPKLPEMCVRLHGQSRTRVLADPFLGLGSTAVAAAKLGVDFIGIELDEHYLKEAIARVRSLN